MLQLTENEFEQLVVDVLDSLPETFLKFLDNNNVDVVIEPRPTQRQLDELGITSGSLFGLYEGIPLTERDSAYNIVSPDKITIFKEVIEGACTSKQEIAEQVRITVIHEVAHYFGIDEDKLDELGWS